ncbi:hypothetical protein, partial [Mesorhizobium sp. M4B.F.Ca.ET.013.02.1.1]|uniref:hypothetical protein n=1 Tax=Mesorhizobium sp. M4B.F.Ca.ET.013.02.1.1 TaxID=2496755 RepID=UPI00167B81BD
ISMRYDAAGCQGWYLASETPPRLSGARSPSSGAAGEAESPGMALADAGSGRLESPIASRRILSPAFPRTIFCVFMTPTFDCGRYQSRLKLLEMKVDKFSEICFSYFI